MDKKISQLASGTTPTGTEEFAVVQSGNTVKLTLNDVAGLSAIPTFQQTLTAGSLLSSANSISGNVTTVWQWYNGLTNYNGWELNSNHVKFYSIYGGLASTFLMHIKGDGSSNDGSTNNLFVIDDQKSSKGLVGLDYYGANYTDNTYVQKKWITNNYTNNTNLSSTYLTIASAAATYQPIGAYLTTISGLNISLLTNDSGYITSSALSPYLTSATAAATYVPYTSASSDLDLNGKSFKNFFISKTADTTARFVFDVSALSTATTRTLTVRDQSGTIALTSDIGTWGALNYPTWSSGTPFVKMTAAGTFALDTNTYLTGNQSITVSGDASGSGATSIALTLATVNSNIGTFNNVTVNAKGLVTAASNVAYITGLTTGTTTIGSGTNTRILYNNSGVLGEYSVTGSGTTAVLSTSPTFTTSIITPLVTGVSGALGFSNAAQSSGAVIDYTFTKANHTGQTASTAVSGFTFTTGSRQWATGAITSQSEFTITSPTYSFVGASTISEASTVSITAPTAGTNATITNNYALRMTAGTATAKFGNLTGTTNAFGVWFNQATPSSTNYTIRSDSAGNTFIGGPQIFLAISGTTQMSMDGKSFTLASFTTQSSGTTIQYQFSPVNNTTQTASTEIPLFAINSCSTGWAAGNITTQRNIWFKTRTLSFASASTVTNAYGLYVESSTAGSGATITNNWSIGTSGNLLSAGSLVSSSATGGVGYFTGAGGTVTQATSRTTGVTLNTICGAITLVSAAGSTSWQTFTVTNSAVAATDTIIVNQKSGTDLYMISVTNVTAGSFKISFATTGGTTTEQPVFNFSVIKAVTA